MTQITKFVTLNDGVVMPRLAFGTGQSYGLRSGLTSPSSTLTAKLV